MFPKTILEGTGMSIRTILVSLGLVVLLAPVGCVAGGPVDSNDDEDTSEAEQPLTSTLVQLCSADSDCPTSQYCRSGVCSNDKTVGGTCTRDAQCTTDMCISGVCSTGSSGGGSGETFCFDTINGIVCLLQ